MDDGTRPSDETTHRCKDCKEATEGLCWRELGAGD